MSLSIRSSLKAINISAYHVCCSNLRYHIRFVVFRIDSTVVGDGIDFLALTSNLSHGVLLGLLKLLDNAVHNINEDYLGLGLVLCHQVHSQGNL